MRKCPNCGYKDEPYWRPAKMHNPSGEVDIARIDDIEFNTPSLAKEILNNRKKVIEDNTFAYYLGKRAIWVKRVDKDSYRVGGISVFKQPAEKSRHNPLSNRISGRTVTTKKGKEHYTKSKIFLSVNK